MKIVKGAIDNASAGYERMTRSAVKAAEVMESNVSTATAQFAEVVEKAGSAHEKVVNAKK